MRPTAAEQAVLHSLAERFSQQDPEIAALAGGLGNRCWRMRDAGRDLVVRFAAAHSRAFGVNRRDEVLAQCTAAAQGLAPPVLWHDTEAGLLVTEFAAGRNWALDAARRPEGAARCGEWLGTLHRLAVPAGLARVDFGERALQLRRSLPPGSLPAWLAERATGERRRLGGTAAPVLCHHDLHYLNIVDRGTRLLVLDWEYAGAGEPLMDLAGYVAYHDLEEAALAALLEAYADAGERPCAERLAAARWLFEFVWLLWLEIRRVAAGHEEAGLAATRRRLMTRLLAAPGA